MTTLARPYLRPRPLRVQMKRPVPATLVREDGQCTRCTLQAVSVTGGLLRLLIPLPQGDFVELAVEADSLTVHGMAEMLPPVRRADRLVQPFRFIALEDQDYRALSVFSDIANDPKKFRSVSALRRL